MHAMRSGASIGDWENHLTTIFLEVGMGHSIQLQYGVMNAKIYNEFRQTFDRTHLQHVLCDII